jgi:hypothetical protein
MVKVVVVFPRPGGRKRPKFGIDFAFSIMSF